MLRFRSPLLLVLAALLWPPFGACAQALSVSADAHVTDNVSDNIPNSYNFGAMSYLLVQNDPARVYKTYLRFDLSPLAKASEFGVRTARLTLTLSRFRDQTPLADSPVKEANTITVYGIADNLDTWAEGARKGENSAADLSFSNAPHNDRGSAAGLAGAGEVDGAPVRRLGSFTVARNAAPASEFALDVAPFVNWALGGGAYGAAPAGDTDKEVTFVLVHSGGNDSVANNGVQFHAKENTAGPGGESAPTLAPRLSYTLETTPPSVKGVVISVVDATTVVVRGVGNIRLRGISALADPARKPRADDDLYGADADRATRRLVAGQRVRLEFEGPPGNAVTPAWVFLEDGSLLNEQLVRRGYARLDGNAAAEAGRYVARLRAAETDARTAKRGLWPKQKTGGQ